MGKIQEAVKTLEENGGIEALRECEGPTERHSKLLEILPEVRLWHHMEARALVFKLQEKHGIDFGICEF